MIRSLFQTKSWVLLISILALAALAILASGLGDVSFRDAQPLARNIPDGGGGAARGMLESWRAIPIWMQLGVWLALFLLVILIGMMLSPETRKLLLRAILRLAATYWVLYFLFTRYGDELALNAMELLNPNANNISPDLTKPPPVFIPTEGMLWAAYAVSFILIFVALIVTWRTYKFLRASREQNDSLNKIAGVARVSIRELSSGRDTADVIMNCYFRMSDAVADKRNLHRRDSMTPAEFATRLEQAGLPGEAVSRLTRLFESVRYGGHRSGQTDVNEATACLHIILVHCGESS